MARVAIIVGHPKPSTYCKALAEAYGEGAKAARHEIKIFNLAALTFDPILHDGFDKLQALEADIASARDAILAADHLVFVFPLWLGTLPALLKGFLERVIAPDLIGPARDGKFVKIWDSKSARIIITMGMPALLYRWYFRDTAVTILRRSILGFLGVKPVRATLIGRIGSLGEKQRAGWLASVRSLGSKLA